ncbi:MAG: flagellar brake protein [Glaciimonas sp.]|nr:flagellar brake protein [Glaciimonas sp.]
MRNFSSLAPVLSIDIALGKPLPWSVYDTSGNLLLASGFVIETQHQLDGLVESGFFRNARWDRPHSITARNSDTRQNEREPLSEIKQDVGSESTVAMDALRWQVGETLYLQSHDNPAIRYTVRLIGFVKNQSVLVTAPILDGKFGFIQNGQAFVVRSFSGKKAYAFAATALKSVHAPYPYLHLSYPQHVRGAIIRKGSRAQVKIIAAVIIGQPERNIATTLTDLSVGGASGTARQTIGVKDAVGRIAFKVHAAGQDALLNLKITLRSVVQAENSEVYNHGFEFVDMTANERLILTAFVHQTLAEID